MSSARSTWRPNGGRASRGPSCCAASSAPVGKHSRTPKGTLPGNAEPPSTPAAEGTLTRSPPTIARPSAPRVAGVIALDASVLVAHLRPADAHHSAATELLGDAVDGDLVAHAITIAEVLLGGVRINRGEEMLTDLRAIGVEVAPLADDEPLRLAPSAGRDRPPHARLLRTGHRAEHERLVGYVRQSSCCGRT